MGPRSRPCAPAKRRSATPLPAWKRTKSGSITPTLTNTPRPKAPRKLLLHKSEIRKLSALAAVKGHALVPLSLYWKNGKVKAALGVAKGKVEFDKREDSSEERRAAHQR